MTAPGAGSARRGARRRALLVGAALAAMLGTAGGARAQVGSLGMGSRAISLGNAFTGVADDLSATYYNPAGLSQLIEGGLRTETGISANSVRVHYRQPIVDELSHARPGETIGQSDVVPDWIVIPSMTVGFPLGDELYLVPLAIVVPFAGAASFDGERGDARFLAAEGTQVVMTWTPSVAWRVTDWLSLGAGFDLGVANTARQRAKLGDGAVGRLAAREVLGAEDAPGAALLSTADGIDDGEMAAIADEEFPIGLAPIDNVNLDFETWGYHLGLMLQPTETVRIGVLYRSALDPVIEGTARIDLQPSIEQHPAYRLAGIASGSARFRMKMPLPRTVAAGVAVDLTPAWMVSVGWWWEDWSGAKSEERIDFEGEGLLSNRFLGHGIQTIRVPKDLRSTHQFRGGAEWRPNDGLRLRGGLWWAPSYAPDRSWDFLADGDDRLTSSLGLGLVHLWDGRLDLDVHAQWTRIATRHIDPGESAVLGGSRELPPLDATYTEISNDGYSVVFDGDVYNLGLTITLRL